MQEIDFVLIVTVLSDLFNAKSAMKRGILD